MSLIKLRFDDGDDDDDEVIKVGEVLEVRDQKP
jgi:hypothetical protein